MGKSLMGDSNAATLEKLSAGPAADLTASGPS
jgi:hypothetical protein